MEDRISMDAKEKETYDFLLKLKQEYWERTIREIADVQFGESIVYFVPGTDAESLAFYLGGGSVSAYASIKESISDYIRFAVCVEFADDVIVTVQDVFFYVIADIQVGSTGDIVSPGLYRVSEKTNIVYKIVGAIAADLPSLGEHAKALHIVEDKAEFIPLSNGTTFLQILWGIVPLLTSGKDQPLHDYLKSVYVKDAKIQPHQSISTIDAQKSAKHATAIRTGKSVFPLDKLNSTVWTLPEGEASEPIAIKVEKKGSKAQINTYYSANFDEFENDIHIAKRLTEYDKRVYMAISSIACAGNELITLTQIHSAMGIITKPNSADLVKIRNSVDKMSRTEISFDNTEEANAYKYDKLVYRGWLLPREEVSAFINGKFSESVIHILREPPLISYARRHGQLTTIDIELLKSPINKTPKNMAIEDYLLYRICRAKRAHKASEKILYQTLYEKAEIASASSKSRAPSTIERLIVHYEKCGYITRHKIDKDSITVYFK